MVVHANGEEPQQLLVEQRSVLDFVDELLPVSIFFFLLL